MWLLYFQASWLPWSKSWCISAWLFCRRHWGSSGTEMYSNGEARKSGEGSGPKRNLQEMWGWCDLECEAQILFSNIAGNVCGYGNRLYHNVFWDNPFLTRTLGYNFPKAVILPRYRAVRSHEIAVHAPTQCKAYTILVEACFCSKDKNGATFFTMQECSLSSTPTSAVRSKEKPSKEEQGTNEVRKSAGTSASQKGGKKPPAPEYYFKRGSPWVLSGWSPQEFIWRPKGFNERQFHRPGRLDCLAPCRRRTRQWQ